MVIDIRDKMKPKEGKRVLFFLDGDALLIKNVKNFSWNEITKSLRIAKKKIREEDVPDLVHKIRKNN